MSQHKIAILTDSGTDVPEEFSKAHGIFTLPLSIQFSDGLYLDGVSITPEEVYADYPLDRLTYDISLAAMACQARMTAALSDFPTRAATRPRTEPRPQTAEENVSDR